MKKSAFPAALVLLAVASSGCPIYDSRDDTCYDDWDCRDGYACDAINGDCVPVSQPNTSSNQGRSCTEPADCGTNETCSRAGICKVGDCHFESIGCLRGYACSSTSGRWQCVAGEQNEAGASSGGEGGAGATGSTTDGAGAPASGGAPG
jgi:hypothetical protein